MSSARHFPSPVTTMFARKVRPGYEQAYEEWLAGISRASSSFPGNQGSTILKPSTLRGEYICITQFESAAQLEAWLCSPERAGWLEKLDAIALDHEEIKELTGMERWFSLPNRAVTQAPAKHKMAALIFIGLYPLVLGLGALLQPLTRELPRAVGVLISLLISVPVMVWIIMPRLTRLFFPWLYPEHRPSRLSRGAKKV